ncbi:MAG: hypothetical protein HON13_02475, partial [Candidatus Thioglobus sp.]|nr:hypothetical protein [Candidatus Thioglobus sp.]
KEDKAERASKTKEWAKSLLEKKKKSKEKDDGDEKIDTNGLLKKEDKSDL